MTVRGDEVEFDLTGSHPTIGSMYNCAFDGTFAAIISGMKTFFPEIPLNSGFYRAMKVTVPDDAIVSARWPVAVSGFVMPFEKIMNEIFELWSLIVPERAMLAAACRGWFSEDPEQVAARFRRGELDVLDAIRRYGVILNWGTDELYPQTTAVFRAAMQRRSAADW